MVAPNPACYHLSASSIASFKACPQRFRLAYREGLRADKDTDSQRVGTNWHAMHETYANALQRADEAGPFEGAADWCLDKVIEHLNQRYAAVPSYKTAAEFALEREVLLMSFVGYLWYYQNDPVEFLASEVAFDLPVHDPRIGLPLPMSEAKRVGKIDHVIRWQGSVCALERKSTSRSIDDDSDYWDKSKKDTQVSMYALAFRELAAIPGALPQFTADRFGNTLYDVWHKPTIKPAMLTQAETRAFIESGEYMGLKFEVKLVCKQDDDPELCARYTINGVAPDREVGKKGFAFRETIEMFGARLLQDIYERPEFYFRRKEIARTDAEIRGFRRELWSVYQSQKNYVRSGCWFENENQCRATYACQYIPICYGAGADAVCDGHTTPDGFKRIFIDLTVNGHEVDQ